MFIELGHWLVAKYYIVGEGALGTLVSHLESTKEHHMTVLKTQAAVRGSLAHCLCGFQRTVIDYTLPRWRGAF